MPFIAVPILHRYFTLLIVPMRQIFKKQEDDLAASTRQRISIACFGKAEWRVQGAFVSSGKNGFKALSRSSPTTCPSAETRQNA